MTECLNCPCRVYSHQAFLLVLVSLPSHARHVMHPSSLIQCVSNQSLQSLPKICVMQSDVGMLRVDAKQLKTALLPSPTALLAQLGQCLPRAAAQLYAAFVDQVHSATSALKTSISSVEDYVQQLAFLETLKVRLLRTGVPHPSAAVVRSDNVTASCRTMLSLVGAGVSAAHIMFFVVRVWCCCSS